MAETASSVTLLRPVRVLVAGDDSQVVGHLRDELLRMGFDAMSTTRKSRIAYLAGVERVNVVLLEVSGGITSAASVASTLEALPQRVQVILAGRHRRAAIKLGYDIVDPDGSSEELAAAVHRAYRGGPARAGRSSGS